jgi:hypothetical protein
MQVFHAVSSDGDRQIITAWRRRMALFYVGIVAAWFVVLSLSWIPDNPGSQFASTNSDEHRVQQGTHAYARPGVIP